MLSFTRKADGSRAPKSGAIGLNAADGFGSEWEKPAPPPTDWKKVFLLIGLGSLSWISTYTGMLELIQANMGEIGLVYKAAIGFAVAMLMLMIVWLLDQLFDRLQPVVRLLFVSGYLFLTLISVGFGFGFYWKFLESRSEASRSAESAVTQVQTALLAAQTRLEQLNATLAQLTTISAQKAIDEREKGNSCPASRPGDGPRRRLRDADASRFGFAQKFIGDRTADVSSDIKVLNGDLEKIVNRDASTIDAKTGTRNVFLKDLGRKLDNSVTRFNAFRTDPQLRQFRTDFADRSQKSVFPNGRGGTFSCPDPELQTALRGVVRAIDQLPELQKPEVKAVEGSEAIIEAFRRLTTTISGVATLRMPPTPDELRAAQQRAVQSVRDTARRRQVLSQQPGLGDRDWIPLFIALFVDFCLLLVSVSRPMQGFQWLEHKMGSAQDGPVIKILSRFRDIHQDEEIRDVFEVFRHVVFDVRGVYYAAIPMNGSDPSSTSDLDPEAAIEAQLLANLFTSFENDKVYRRVVAPLFPTGYVQKKLRTQGSKFAEAESFRLYRFEKDQWQDWMLSAMMGAAKRVEARKRIERTLFTGDAPALRAHPEPVDEAEAPTLDHLDDGEPAAAEADSDPAQDNEADAEFEDAFAREIASEIDETLFNQSYEREEALRRREIAHQANVHVLRAEANRTPEHVIPHQAVFGAHENATGHQTGHPPALSTERPLERPAERQVVNAAFMPVPPVAAPANDQTVGALAGPQRLTPPNGSAATNTPPQPASSAPAAPFATPVSVAQPRTVSLIDRASNAWSAHTTERDAGDRPIPLSAPAASMNPMPIEVPNKSAVSVPEENEEKKMPAIQVHDALPKNLRIQPAPPVALQPRAVTPVGEAPMAPRLTPHQPQVSTPIAAPAPITKTVPAPRAIASENAILLDATPQITPTRQPFPASASLDAIPAEKAAAGPAPVSATPTKTGTQLSLLDEPTDLPTMFRERTDTASARTTRTVVISETREEPEFGTPAEPFDDTAIDNITSWYGRADGKRGRR